MRTTAHQKVNHKPTTKPHTTSKRGIISYATQKRPNFFRAQAKKVLKKGEKKPNEYKLDPKMENPVGLTQQVLPSGVTVNIFKEKKFGEPRQFGAILQAKRPRVNLDLETAEERIHNISTRVARASPIVVQESSLKNIKNEFISNLQNFTQQDYQQNGISNFIVRIAPPTFMKAQMFNRSKGPKSLNQKKRWDNLVQERGIEISQQKKAHQAFIQTLINSSEGIDAATVTSSATNPIDFTNNLGLKFRIIDAVIKSTNIEVPASALVSINNTTDLVSFMIDKKTQLDAHGKREKQKLPENVTFIYTDPINRKKQPKWTKYKELREKKNIAGATADV